MPIKSKLPVPLAGHKLHGMLRDFCCAPCNSYSAGCDSQYYCGATFIDILWMCYHLKYCTLFYFIPPINVPKKATSHKALLCVLKTQVHEISPNYSTHLLIH